MDFDIRESIEWDFLGSWRWAAGPGARPGVGTLSPLPKLARRTGEASYLVPSARTDRATYMLHRLSHRQQRRYTTTHIPRRHRRLDDTQHV